MSERFMKTQDIVFEVETKDSTLGSHTDRRIYYIKPTTDGQPGVVADAAFVAGTAVAGESGNSVNQGAALNFDRTGPWRWWSESVNQSGRKCISPAFEAIVEERGTYRR